MSGKFLIVLFVSIFYYGLTNCSPLNETTSELTAKERQNISVVTNSNHTIKVESASPIPENRALHNETSTIINSKTIVEGGNKSFPVNPVGNNKTTGQVIDHNNATSTIPTKSPNANSSITTSVPVTTSVTPVPVTKATANVAPNNSEMPRPIPSGQSTTLAPTPHSGATTKVPEVKPSIVTSTPIVQTSTENITMEHNSAPQAQGNRFDGASFVGGIVLTIGLTAIGFIAFKYYKSGKIDGNYRTL